MIAIIIAYSEEGITARGVTCVFFLLGVCAAGFSEPLPQYSLFCGQI